MHLIEPLGFQLDDRRLRRAGLDYHEYSQLRIHPHWEAFLQDRSPGRILGFSTHGRRCHADFRFQPGDHLVFGSETRGLPQELRDRFDAESLLRIPMLPESRSLNLSNAVAVVVYEAWRQQGFVGGG